MKNIVSDAIMVVESLFLLGIFLFKDMGFSEWSKWLIIAGLEITCAFFLWSLKENIFDDKRD